MDIGFQVFRKTFEFGIMSEWLIQRSGGGCWTLYAFPGFRPQSTVRGAFGDPKARVIALVRRANIRPQDTEESIQYRGEA